eukprot:589801-Pyramimonas_sp.AAC.2
MRAGSVISHRPLRHLEDRNTAVQISHPEVGAVFHSRCALRCRAGPAALGLGRVDGVPGPASD